MKLTYTRTGASTGRLILIMAGWSTSHSLYSHISMPGWDVAVITECSSPVGLAEVVRRIKEYPTVYLYAWSLGVRAAGKLYEAGMRFTASFAVNGTGNPVSDTCGIPEKVFRDTCTHLDPRNLKKFRMRMCGGLKAHDELFPSADYAAEPVGNLKRELEAVLSLPSDESGIPWTIAYISDSDAIFPPANQLRYWQDRNTTVCRVQGPHYLDLRKIVAGTVVDIPKAGKSFARSMSTYSAHATAQKRIASELARMTALELSDKEVGTMLELGCGSGELTRAISSHLAIGNATFIDLYECGPFGIALEERYLTGDAELLIEDMPDRFDLICSASAMQWFSDTDRFLKNCSLRLADGGLLALSTFAEGNLRELDGLRRSSIGYLSPLHLREMARKYFSTVHIETGRIELSFPSAAEALRHLRLTGVTASSASPLSPAVLRRFIAVHASDPFTLTFLPVYILCRH